MLSEAVAGLLLEVRPKTGRGAPTRQASLAERQGPHEPPSPGASGLNYDGCPFVTLRLCGPKTALSLDLLSIISTLTMESRSLGAPAECTPAVAARLATR
jgi:hypothetical protein